MKFERTEEYEGKLFLKALDEAHVIRDARITIIYGKGYKLKAYCEDSKTFLQFPRGIREYGQQFVADVYEVIRNDDVKKYYRVMNGSIRKSGSDEVVG